MSAQHTPAPLTRTDIARLYRSVYGVSRMDACTEQFAREVEKAAIEAAAASDLLAACIRLLGLFDRERCQEVKEDLDAAAAAIAKATGGQA